MFAPTRSHQPALLDEAGDDRPLDRPGEPLPDLVLMCEHFGAHADERELRERLFLVGFPRLRPDLIPARELGGVFVAALPVVDLDVA